MTIRPGDGWGEIMSAPLGTRWFDSEAELCAFLDASTAEVPVGLTGGDLHLVTGRPTATMRVSLDEMVVRYVPAGSATTRTTRALSFVTVGRWWSPREFSVVSNSGMVNGSEWFARSHPNDGKVESATFLSTLGLRQRAMAMRRITRGEAFTHPQITQRSVATWEWSGTRSRLIVDGRSLGQVTTVSIQLRPDALSVYVGAPSTAH